MKIAIIASSAFVKEMVEWKRRLESAGHEVILHQHYIEQADGGMRGLRQRMATEHAAVKREYDYIRWHYQTIVESDAVLALNFDKNGVEHYIGGNTFLELGFAYVHHKKIFLLNPIPAMGYTEEIKAMEPILIHNDPNKIK